MADINPSTAVKREKERFKANDFLLSATLGTGTFGRVRLVKYLPTEKFYAMKIMKKCEILRLKQLEHIKSEVLLLSKLHHPFIVNLAGHLQDDKRLYLILDYVQGGELFSYLRRLGRLPDDSARFYAAQLVLAFAYMHRMNIIYRDLKPENLLIASNGSIKITDFGFAKEVEDRTWTLCGTPEYLAPEIIQSKGHGKSVDWWALGVLIYEMLAGYPPFFDENPFGIYQKILAGKVDYPRHFDAKARDLIKRLLTADRTKRLGCLKNESEDVSRHKYFGKIDWSAMYNEELAAPYIPPISGAGDHRNFDAYPDSPVDNAIAPAGADKKAFDMFDEF